MFGPSLWRAGLPHNDIAAQICRQAGLVKHPEGSKAHGHGTADLLGVDDGVVSLSVTAVVLIPTCYVDFPT